MMKRFRHDTHGAVTVIVTLLLIPALLLSGTAVDISRIYSARSVLQDANQLAANSTLASYDALLKDLYGLYGVMVEDPELGEMISEYIDVAVFGEDTPQGMGTWQLFYGSNVKTEGAKPVANQNLANPVVLRRQIEEYAKFRAPVIIVQDILDRIEQFKQTQKDAEVIKQKSDIDDKIEELEKIYKKIYDKINELNACKDDETRAFTELNEILEKICDEMSSGSSKTLTTLYDDYNRMKRDEESGAELGEFFDDELQDIVNYYDGLRENVAAFTDGGVEQTYWKYGSGSSGKWEAGKFNSSNPIDKTLVECLDEWHRTLKSYQDKFDELISLGNEADSQKSSLSAKVQALKTKLNTEGECSEELKKGLTEKQDGQNMSTIEYYESLLTYDVGEMCQRMKDADYSQLDGVVKTFDKSTFEYGEWNEEHQNAYNHIGIDDLKRFDKLELFDIDWYWNQKDDRDGIKDDDDAPSELLYSEGPSIVKRDDPNTDGNRNNDFKKFSECGEENSKFYKLLQEMFGAGAETKKANARKALQQIFDIAKDLMEGVADYTPEEGAWTYGGAELSGSNEDNLISQDKWNEDTTKQALNNSFFSQLAELGGDMADYVLLLTYDSEMFSCWATRGETEKKGSPIKTMTGQNLNAENNYFYESELEFLYGGEYSAPANLMKVSGMILLVRFVFNYIASFSVDSVKDIVKTVRDACTVTGPFKYLIGELVRMALALGESVLDLSRLRSGHTVSLYKNNDNWKFSIEGIANVVQGIATNVTYKQNGSEEDDTSELDDEKQMPMSYVDYLRIFLIFVGKDKLTDRTAELIEINLTYKKLGLSEGLDHTEKENAMANAEPYDLTKLCTSFYITTTADLRMVFLSMPVFRNSADGVIPPGTVKVSATDYRGY